MELSNTFVMNSWSLVLLFTYNNIDLWSFYYLGRLYRFKFKNKFESSLQFSITDDIKCFAINLHIFWLFSQVLRMENQETTFNLYLLYNIAYLYKLVFMFAWI